MTAAAGGARSIVVGGDVIRGILVTGDHNRVFVGDYEQLHDAYIEPWSVFQRVDVAGFVGREWLTAALDDFLATEDRGYFVLEAPAGVGKTAFLAHLVERRGYLHHFVETARGQDGVAPALRSLAAQVVRAGELLPYSVDEVLPAAAGSRPDFFAHLLRRASDQRRDERDKIVIVVDGLDEAGTPIGHNVLGLPEVLPAGVYLVVSQRPVPVRLDIQGPVRVFPMAAGDEQNLADMRRFLQASAGVAAVLRDADHAPAYVVETLLARSAGVWIYLHYVLADLARGGPIDLAGLPDGLWAYYARFWRRWRDERRDEWYRRFLPLLATLAAVQEDAPADLLATLAGVDGGPALTALLEEDWLPFLAVTDGRYRPYHASVREFLEGRLDPTGRRAMDVALARELARAVHDAHTRIADRYLDGWGGPGSGLSGLRSGYLRDDGYGLRYLAAHLTASGRHDDLDRLLRLDPAAGNVWFGAHDAGGDLSAYQADVARAWRAARERESGGLAAETRYALHTASVNALAHSVRATLLVGLVRAGVWTPAKGLAYARQTPDQRDRSAMLGGLAEATPVALQSALLGAVEALDDEHRAGALDDVVEHLPAGLLSRAGRALDGMSSYQRETVAARLAVRLGRAGRWDEAFRVLAANPDAQPAAFADLALDLPGDRLDAAVAMSTAVPALEERARALVALLPRLRGDGAVAAERTVLAAMGTLGTDVVMGLFAAMPPWSIPAREAIDLIERWRWPWARARGLARLAGTVGRADLADRVLAEAQAVEVEPDRRNDGWLMTGGPARGWFERADAFGPLLPAQAVAAAREAFTAALDDVFEHGTWSYAGGMSSSGPAHRHAAHRHWFGAAPVLLAARLPEADARELLDFVTGTIDAIPNPVARALLLAQLVPDAAPAHRDRLLAPLESATDEIGDAKERGEILLDVLDDVDGPARDRLAARIIGTLPHRDVVDRLLILNRLAPALSLAKLAAALPAEAEWTAGLRPETARRVDALLPALSPAAVERVIRAARRVEDTPAQLAAAAGLAPHLPAGRRAAVLARVVAFRDDPYDKDEYSYAHGRVVARLARRLAVAGHPDEAIDVAAGLRHRRNVWPSERHDTLTDLARLLAPADPAAALRAVGRIDRDDERTHALRVFLDHAPDDGLALARGVFGAGLTEPAAWVPDESRDDPEGTATEVLARAARADSRKRAHLIAGVAHRLDTGDALRALTLAENLQEEYEVETAVRAVTTRLVELGRLDEATAAVLRLPDVVIYSEDSMDDSTRTEVLTDHVRRLADHGHLGHARRAAAHLPDEHRSEALIRLAERYAATGALGPAMECALIIDDDEYRGRALAAVAGTVTGVPPADLLPAIRTVLSRAPMHSRAALLTDIGAFAPVLVLVGGPQAAQDIDTALEDVTHWWP